MKLIAEWHTGWANRPRLEIQLPPGESLPPYPAQTSPVWEQRGGIHRALQGPWVRYFYTDGKPTQGFGGRTFTGTRKDNTTFEYKGAWSSRAACVNALFPDEPIVDVAVNYQSIGMLASVLLNIWAEDPEATFGIALVNTGGEYVLEPTYPDGQLKPDSPVMYTRVISIHKTPSLTQNHALAVSLRQAWTALLRT